MEEILPKELVLLGFLFLFLMCIIAFFPFLPLVRWLFLFGAIALSLKILFGLFKTILGIKR